MCSCRTDGHRARGGARENFEIAGGGFIATGADDEAVAARVEWVRQRVGFYGSTRAYWPVFEAHGLEDLGQKLLGHSRAGTWDRMAGEISDDVLGLFTAIGRHDEIAGVIEARFAGVADSINASVASDIPAGLPADLIQDIQRIPRAFTGFRTAAWE